MQSKVTSSFIRHGMFYRSLAIVLSFCVFFTIAHSSQAALDQIKTGLNTAAGEAGLSASGGEPEAIEKIVGRLINAALGIIGVLLLVYLIYGGFMWMTAGGTEDRVKKAQTMIKNALTGIIVIVMAAAIANWVVDQMITAVQGGAGGGQASPPVSTP